MATAISVIVPVYNAENYIRECIESILYQTYSDFELLLIDDGSNDRSGCICDEYYVRDSRVKVIHKENGGVSSARNYGLKIAQGKWIMFVDADDVIAENTLEKILLNAELNNVDFLQYSLTHDKERFGYSKNSPSPCSVEEYVKNRLFLVGIGGSFIKRSIIISNNIHFDETIKLAEDLIFIHNCLAHSRICQRLYDTLYYYRYNPDSSSKNKNSKDLMLSCIAQIKLKKHYPLFSAAIDSSITNYILSIIINNDFDENKLDKLIIEALPFNKSMMRGSQLLFAYLAQFSIKQSIKFIKWKFKNKLLSIKF